MIAFGEMLRKAKKVPPALATAFNKLVVEHDNIIKMYQKKRDWAIELTAELEKVKGAVPGCRCHAKGRQCISCVCATNGISCTTKCNCDPSRCMKHEDKLCSEACEKGN